MAEWQPIETAPDDDRDVMVGGWVEGEWWQTISSRDDRPMRRGYRHRNGAQWATHWWPLPTSRPPMPTGDAFT
jgi:hypothetical protein